MAKVKYSGVAIDAGETPLIVPALSFRQLQDEKELLDRTGDEKLLPMERIAAKIEVVKLAVGRNYPDGADDLNDRLDLANIAAAFDAALGVSKEVRTRGED